MATCPRIQLSRQPGLARPAVRAGSQATRAQALGRQAGPHEAFLAGLVLARLSGHFCWSHHTLIPPILTCPTYSANRLPFCLLALPPFQALLSVSSLAGPLAGISSTASTYRSQHTPGCCRGGAHCNKTGFSPGLGLLLWLQQHTWLDHQANPIPCSFPHSSSIPLHLSSQVIGMCLH